VTDALTATEDFAEGNMLQVMTFGVVLFTLLGQGTSMQFLLRREGLIERDQSRVEYERRHGRLVAARAARDRVHELYQENVIAARTWEHLAAQFDRQIEQCAEAQHQLLDKQPELHAAEIDDAWREGLRAQRVMVTDLVKDGVISEPVYAELVAEIDNALANEAEKNHLRTEKVRAEQAETRRLDAEAEERAKTEQAQSEPPATESQSTERLDES